MKNLDRTWPHFVTPYPAITPHPFCRVQTARHGAGRVAVARKLAVILHRMWAEATEFRFENEPAALAA